MKNIKELTEKEGEEILEFVYPNNELNLFMGINFEPKLENGELQLTFDLLPIIGILYHNGLDNCILYFDNTKVVLWLYRNGYDITKMLEANSYMSEAEKDFDNFSAEISWMAKGEKGFRNGYEKNWTLDYVIKKCEKLLDEYYYKDRD